MKTILDFRRVAAERSVSMVTCYDYWTARIVEASDVDCILVGDSVAMVAHGHDTTIPATVEMMATHVAAVRRGAPTKLLIADFPFLAHRLGVAAAVETAAELMRAGAQAVKIEGLAGHADVIGGLVEGGVPVMGHLGLGPQSVHQLGGYRVQATDDAGADRVVDDARALEELGCFGIVLEAIPPDVGRRVTGAVGIPTIGIGAGAGTTGQVLVLQDLLGMNESFQPRFVRRYLEGEQLVRGALDRFAGDVRDGSFPAAAETYE